MPARFSRPLAFLFLLVAGAVSSAAAQQDRLLTLSDLSPDLARLIGGTPLDFVANARITYGVTGNSSYDDFFRNSAVSYGGFMVGRRLTNQATLNLKKYARSKVAVAEMKDQIAELTQGADTASWTTEQALAVLAAAKKRDQLSAEESAYMLSMAANLAAAIPMVEASVSSSTQLTSTAPAMVSGARSSFGVLKAGSIGHNVQQSADRLATIPTEGPKLVEAMLVLSKGLAMINGN
ncbi:MAG: hypothetical protein ABI836_15035 [Gemmatimonadota bacterium]